MKKAAMESATNEKKETAGKRERRKKAAMESGIDEKSGEDRWNKSNRWKGGTDGTKMRNTRGSMSNRIWCEADQFVREGLSSLKAIRLIAVLLIVVLFAVGCGRGNQAGGNAGTDATNRSSDGAGDRAPQTTTTLTVMSWWDITQSEPLQKLKAGFEERNPDLKLEFTMVGGAEYQEKVLAMIAGGGDLPDVIMLAMDKIPMFADRGAILPLDGYADRAYLDSLYPVVKDALSFDGKVYAVARDITTKVMFLNKKMFDDADVPYPEPDWTWEQFVDTAKKLTTDDQWGFYFPKYADGFAHWLFLNGGGLVTNDGVSQLGLPESREMLQRLQDLIVKEKIVPTDSQAQQFGAADNAPFIANKVAMVAGGLSYTSIFKQNGIEYVIRPLPKIKKTGTTSFVNAWAIPKGAENPDLSWRVLEFFSGAEGQQIVLDTGMGLPASTGVDTSAFLAQHPDNRTFIDSLETAVPFPTPVHGAAFNTLVQEELDLMWLGQIDVDKAVDEVERQAPAVLAGE